MFRLNALHIVDGFREIGRRSAALTFNVTSIVMEMESCDATCPATESRDRPLAEIGRTSVVTDQFLIIKKTLHGRLYVNNIPWSRPDAQDYDYRAPPISA